MNVFERLFVGVFGDFLLGLAVYVLMFGVVSLPWRLLASVVFGVLGGNAIYGTFIGKRPWLAKIGPLP